MKNSLLKNVLLFGLSAYILPLVDFARSLVWGIDIGFAISQLIAGGFIRLVQASLQDPLAGLGLIWLAVVVYYLDSEAGKTKSLGFRSAKRTLLTKKRWPLLVMGIGILAFIVRSAPAGISAVIFGLPIEFEPLLVSLAFIGLRAIFRPKPSNA